MAWDSSNPPSGEAIASPPSAPQSLPSCQIWVCQNTTCRKDGASAVLQALQASASDDCTIVAGGCLGHCGSGPMVWVQPDDVWYSAVHPQDAAAIAARHASITRSPTPHLEPAQATEQRSQRALYSLVGLAVCIAIASLLWTLWILV